MSTATPSTGTARIRPATEADRGAVTELLADLSPESAYRRFQASPGPVPPPAVVTALLPSGPDAGAVLAYDGATVVGHGIWRRTGAGAAAEIGLVVADDHQGRGIGSALARALLADLASHDVEQVEVFTTASNDAVAHMVARYAPGAAPHRDGPTVTYSLSTGVAERRRRAVHDRPTEDPGGPRRRCAA
ncbi:GNAT family N-acetyltransferase [Nocardioides sp. GY 10113]|uniref:GNAT family N-acetyltransferase n=1 Tax=Nocardioides sp. GY 10113 TaxID=2569761 RepID=UPI0010A87E34|nr:GNAT family N-acetyltransferase [Nocardioides sp. GY 10113]TIC88255.1 GNAT family N-acetyltransferase [Nocardioides sp. GY 10113]